MDLEKLARYNGMSLPDIIDELKLLSEHKLPTRDIFRLRRSIKDLGRSMYSDLLQFKRSNLKIDQK